MSPGQFGPTRRDSKKVGAVKAGIAAGKSGNFTQLSQVCSKSFEMQFSTCRIFFCSPLVSFVNIPVRKTLEEKLNEKRQHLLPPPEFSEEDRKAHAIAMVLYKDCEKYIAHAQPQMLLSKMRSYEGTVEDVEEVAIDVDHVPAQPATVEELPAEPHTVH